MTQKQPNPPPPKTRNEPISATPFEIAKAFTEWDRRWREDPESFESEAVHLLKGTPETYGEEATPYFLSILQEIQGK